VRLTALVGTAELLVQGDAHAFALVLPSLLAALTLWLVLTSTTDPRIVTVVVPAVLALVFSHIHVARLAAGLSLAEAQERRWLLPATEGSLFGFFGGLDMRAVRWSILLSPAALFHVASAAIVGPVLTTSLNLWLLQQSLPRRALEISAEARSHGLACLAAGAAAGAPCYFSLSVTAVHYNSGAVTWISSWVAVLVALAFLVVPAGMELVGYLPRAIVSTICIYAGFDFLWDGLVRSAAVHADFAAVWVTFALCSTRLGTLGGGVVALVLHTLLVSARDEMVLATFNQLQTPDQTPQKARVRAADTPTATPPRTTRSRAADLKWD